MDPRKFTVYPIVSRTLREKKRQNKRKGVSGWSFILQRRKSIKQNKRILISVEAARDNKWFTSDG
jgi:hypothetical protein